MNGPTDIEPNSYKGNIVATTSVIIPIAHHPYTLVMHSPTQPAGFLYTTGGVCNIGFTPLSAYGPMASDNATTNGIGSLIYTTMSPDSPCALGYQTLGSRLSQDSYHDVMSIKEEPVDDYWWIQSPYFPSASAGQLQLGLGESSSWEYIQPREDIGYSSSSNLTPQIHSPVLQAPVPIQTLPATGKAEQRQRKCSSRKKRNSLTTKERDEIRQIMREKRGLRKPMPWKLIGKFVNEKYKKKLDQGFKIPALEMMHNRDKLRPLGPRKV